MPDYKLYFLSKSRRVEAREDLEAYDDAQAIAHAERHGDGRAMELWQDQRIVKRFPPKEHRR